MSLVRLCCACARRARALTPAAPPSPQIIPLFAMNAKKAAAVAETHAARAFELRDGKKSGPSAADMTAIAAAKAAAEEAAAKAAAEAAAIAAAAAAAAAAASSSSEYIDEEEEESEGSFTSSYEDEEEEEESEEDSYVRAMLCLVFA